VLEEWREEQGDFIKHAAGVSEGGRKVGATERWKVVDANQP